MMFRLGSRIGTTGGTAMTDMADQLLVQWADFEGGTTYSPRSMREIRDTLRRSKMSANAVYDLAYHHVPALIRLVEYFVGATPPPSLKESE